MNEVLVREVPFAATSLDNAVQHVLRSLREGGAPGPLRFVNAYSLALATQQEAYGELLARAGCNYPDGRPVAALVSYLSPGRNAGQVRGPAFFSRLMDLGQEQGVRHYFLGGHPEVLTGLINEAKRRFPEIVIAGADSPPFRRLSDDERRSQMERIAAARPDIVWVGLGTPKQDYEAAMVQEGTGVTAAAVGAAFDFFCGAKPEAPALVRRLGLEWLHRFSTEPRRLWRRYLIGNSLFLVIAAREVLRKHR